MIAGKLGSVIASIQDNNYKVTGVRLYRLSVSDAERFFVAYKGVWDDYPVYAVF